MSDVNQYLDVFSEASPAHARSIMSTPGQDAPFPDPSRYERAIA